ncbi:hypothetical protein [Nocardioides sp.]|uniref:hypothetical protein n=1 Tax=Nocardioides sp. TaxID=35761 RepID=UPI002CDAC3CB|nr:hypothetical protein [Nocardioides sp.]HXH77305.1 hypothetical protein [Nocardioides sp.]
MPWRGPQEPGEFPTLGHVAAEWIEEVLSITDGPKIGEPFQLYDEQYAHQLHRYRIDPGAPGDAGNEAFVRRGSMWVRGQKWGKDPILAAQCLFHAFGPCDFAGYDANGEPVGRPHPSPWVGIAALNDKQADNTWLIVKAMIEASELYDLPGVEVNLEQARLPSGNPIEKFTTTAWGRLGGRFTNISLTENGLMTNTGEAGQTGKRSPLAFARTLIRSVIGMNGMWQAATNTWDPTEHSHAQEVYETRPKDGMGRTYIDIKSSRRRVELDDDEGLRDELLYLYGDSARENGGHVSVKSLVADVRDLSNGEAESRRFFLSEFLAGERPLATPEAWGATAVTLPDPDPLKPGDRVTLGFDGSRSRDCTVITACRIRDGRVVHLRTWRPADYEDHKVPRLEVDKAVRDAFKAYEVWYLYGDPYRWQDYLDTWAALFPNRVVEVPTNVEKRMDEIIERFTTALRNDEISHGGPEDATLTTHVEGSALAKGSRKKAREDEDGGRVEHYMKVVKKRDDGSIHIDAAISMLLAFDARGRAIEDGALDVRPVLSPVGISQGLDGGSDPHPDDSWISGNVPDWNNLPL